jgi:hypothetical protein
MAAILGVTTRTIERRRRDDPQFVEAIGRGQSLFETAVKRYIEGPFDYLPQALIEPTARASIERSLSTTIHIWTGSDKALHGNLILQAALTSADGSRIIRRELETTREAIESVLRKRIEFGVSDGELLPDTDCAGLARYFMTVIVGLAVNALSGLGRKDLLATAATAMKVWPRRYCTDIATFLQRFPNTKIAGSRGFVDFTELFAKLRLPSFPQEQVMIETPDHRSMTFREFDGNAKLRDISVLMTGQFQVEHPERFAFGRALAFLKGLPSSNDPLEDFRQFWRLVALQDDARLDKAITAAGGQDAFDGLLRQLF